jgi:hypothetical protein
MRMLPAFVLLFLSPAGLQESIDSQLKTFGEAMKAAKSDAERLEAVEALASTRHPKAAAKLVTVVSSPLPPAVRAAAAEAVGRIGDSRIGAGLQGALSAFGGLLSSENPNRAGDQKVAEAVVRALGTLRDRSAVRQLTNLLISNNIPLMGEAVRALGKIRDPGCLDGLLKLHYAANAPEGVGATNPRKPLAPDTLAALRRITGQTLTTPDEWNRWYRAAGRAFVPPPEESLGGLPPEVLRFAVYAGKGELDALRKVDLVLLDPDNYTKAELATLPRPIALKGDPKEALEKGCAGFVCEPGQAAALRKKHPRALIVARGADRNAGPHVNAFLVELADPKRPDDKMSEELKEAAAKHQSVALAVFVAATKEAAKDGFDLARRQGWLAYAAQDADYAAPGGFPQP